MTIELPGFENIHNGAVYAQPIGDHIVDILLLRRYVEQTEDDVVAYLAGKAADALSTKSLILPGKEEAVLAGKSKLERLLVFLPDQILRDIGSGANNAHEFIQSNAPARKLAMGETANSYLQIINGTIPVSVIDDNQGKQETSLDAEWYAVTLMNDALRKHGYGHQYTIQLNLENGVLPSRDVIETLLHYEVRTSRPFNVVMGKYDTPAISAVYGAVSTAFSTLEAIAEVRDVRSSVLDEVSIQPVRAFHEFVLAQIERARVAGGLPSGMPRGPILGRGNNGGSRLN